MGYSIGTGENGRDIGYGVIAICDKPGCDEKIDRGMSYCCGGYVGDHGCGLYFCTKHLQFVDVREPEERGVTEPLEFGDTFTGCDRCAKGKPPYEPKGEHPDWMWWKLNHHSWKTWRSENRKIADQYRYQLKKLEYKPSEEILEWAKS